MKYTIEQDQMKEKKANDMVLYKEQLDKQMGVKKRQAMYGNMTGVEKQLNKEELEAYKNYEKGTHFLPGFNNKPHQEHHPHKHTDRDPSIDDYRLDQYGFLKDDLRYKAAIAAGLPQKQAANLAIQN